MESEKSEVKGRQKKRILLVEDDADLLDFLMEKLQGSGYEVITASDGLQGWEKATQEELDLIVTDIAMPRMNGYTMLQMIREKKSLKKTPVIIISGVKEEYGRKDSWQGQFDINHFLLKPFEPEELLNKIDELLCNDDVQEDSAA